jgi:hypothetical protein
MPKFVNALLLSLICLPLCLGQVGCATVASNLPVIIAAVMDAEMILSSLQSFVDAFFKVKPDEALEKKVRDAMARTRSALNAALRLAQGAEKLDQAKIDEAFADFKAAYAELIVILAPLGVSMSGSTLKATPGGGLIVPEPLALTLKAR